MAEESPVTAPSPGPGPAASPDDAPPVVGHLGLVGLGRMGGNMRARLRARGIEVTGYDRNPAVSDVPSLEALVAALPADAPRYVWVMLPAGAVTQSVVDELAGLLGTGDVVVDGGNSYYGDDRTRAAALEPRGIGYVDVGVSGGVWGETEGYGLMVGGADAHYTALLPVLDALRPDGPRDESVVHAGGVGAGHYAKMVHNGIEYGLMQAYAEGFALLEKTDVVTDVAGTVKAWTRGTVVRSWLLDLLVRALEEDPGLTRIDDYVEDSGEGRWTVDEAIANAVPLPAITASVYARFASREQVSPASQAVAALRQQFGGHAVRAAQPPAGGARSGDAPGAGPGDAPGAGSGAGPADPSGPTPAAPGPAPAAG